MCRSTIIAGILVAHSVAHNAAFGQEAECTEQRIELADFLGRVIVVEQALPNAWQDAGIGIRGALETTDRQSDGAFMDVYEFEADVGDVVAAYLSYFSFYGALVLETPRGDEHHDNNNSDDGYAAIVYPVLEKGTHRLVVIGYGCQTGPYLLYVGTAAAVPVALEPR